MFPSLRNISTLGFLTLLAIGECSLAQAEKPQPSSLEIENRTAHRIDNIRLTSGEKFADEVALRSPSDAKRTGLGPGLRTYGIAISAVSLGSDVHARCQGKEVIFRCHTPIAQRPGTGDITCVLTEDQGFRKAEYIPTAYPLNAEMIPAESLGKNQIAILGTVKRPGIFAVESGAALTLEQALELAGGLHEGDGINAPAASPRNIRLFRNVGGETRTFKLDASIIRGKRGKDSNFPVLPGDRISVPYLF